jgi:hypothetical protein
MPADFVTPEAGARLNPDPLNPDPTYPRPGNHISTGVTAISVTTFGSQSGKGDVTFRSHPSFRSLAYGYRFDGAKLPR